MDTQSFTIYLIKEGLEEIALFDQSLPTKNIVGVGNLYYSPSRSKSPSWAKLFEEAGYSLSDLYSASASAILIVQSKNRLFALTFGNAARFWLKDGVCVERFGLITTLNSTKDGLFKSLDTKNITINPLQTKEQSNKLEKAESFGIDPEQDLLKQIVARPHDVTCGSYMSGKDSLRVSVRSDLNQLKNLLGKLLDNFSSDVYKQDFGWIDLMREVTDKTLLETLNSKIITEYNSDSSSKLWLVIPDIIDWGELKGFRFVKRKRSEIHNDVHIRFLKEVLPAVDGIEALRNKHIFAVRESDESILEKWSILKCLYLETEVDDNCYFLSEGAWYKVSNDLVFDVKNEFKEIADNSIDFGMPDCGEIESENEYNNRYASMSTDLVCLDGRLLQFGGKRSSIEFADLYSKDRKIFHLKKYTGSSSLSHLFMQGMNSAAAFKDAGFRKKLNDEILPTGFKIRRLSENPNYEGDKYHVVFGIISTSQSALDIPFFSKLTLRIVNIRLKQMGYQVSINKVYRPKA
jgi:uncharacterized protein (TIGR04141 family)